MISFEETRRTRRNTACLIVCTYPNSVKVVDCATRSRVTLPLGYCEPQALNLEPYWRGLLRDLAGGELPGGMRLISDIGGDPGGILWGETTHLAPSPGIMESMA